ncbi:uncharacterized protein C8A04DRAFT_13693, partial [Dichotomopilus funicola]
TPTMWSPRALFRFSILARLNKPKFKEIQWTDDGEVRPVTRGKAKQFGLPEARSPRTVVFNDGAPYRMLSNASCASHAPLTVSASEGIVLENVARARTRRYQSFLKV